MDCNNGWLKPTACALALAATACGPEIDTRVDPTMDSYLRSISKIIRRDSNGSVVSATYVPTQYVGPFGGFQNSPVFCTFEGDELEELAPCYMRMREGTISTNYQTEPDDYIRRFCFGECGAMWLFHRERPPSE